MNKDWRRTTVKRIPERALGGIWKDRQSGVGLLGRPDGHGSAFEHEVHAARIYADVLLDAGWFLRKASRSEPPSCALDSVPWAYAIQLYFPFTDWSYAFILDIMSAR